MRADSCNLPGTLLHDFITVFALRKEENEEVICHIRSAKMLGKSALTKKHKKQKEKNPKNTESGSQAYFPGTLIFTVCLPDSRRREGGGQGKEVTDEKQDV